jgi:enoyl-CoA hydratase/carnithine racemase
MGERVTISIADGVADVRLNRPDKMNALDLAMFDALARAGETLRSAQGLRAVVLSGEGRAFSAGLDIASFAEQGGLEAALLERSHGLANRFQHAAMLWRDLPVPVISALHGVCFGGGLQIALGADIRIASPDALLSVMEIKWGLVPDMGAFVLTRGLVRDDVMRDLTYSGREFRAEEAQALGLVTRLSASPREDAMECARQIASRSPDAVRAAKRLFAVAHTNDAAAILLAESREQAAVLAGSNQREAVTANWEKRAPIFND